MSAAEQQQKTSIGIVPSDKVVEIWEYAEPLFARVVRPFTGWSLDTLLTAFQTGHFQLWTIGDFKGVAATQIQLRPIEKVLWVQFIAGNDMDEWLDDWSETMDAFAQAHDCPAIEFSGRPGWKKINERYPQYKPILTTFRREL